MILSRVEIPWPAARDPYQHHRRLWQLFPETPAETRRTSDAVRHGFLFRVEQNRPGQPATILMQSRIQPQPAMGVRLLASRMIDPKPSIGQRLAFLLTANPIKTIRDTELSRKTPKRRQSCRVPLLHEKDQREWLRRKLAGAAEVETTSLLPHQPLFFHKGDRAGKLVTLTYEGTLQVENPQRLLALMTNGVGPAKAFGCGLLLVRRMT
jgi:CRISPR system Cascade subunit CasE